MSIKSIRKSLLLDLYGNDKRNIIYNLNKNDKIKKYSKSKSLALPDLKFNTLKVNSNENNKQIKEEKVKHNTIVQKSSLKYNMSENTIPTLKNENLIKKKLPKRIRLLNKLYGENNDLIERINKYKIKNNKLALSSKFNLINYQSGLVDFAYENCSHESINHLMNNLKILNEQIKFKFSFKRTRWELVAEKLSKSVPKFLTEKFYKMAEAQKLKFKKKEKQLEPIKNIKLLKIKENF